jgi:protein involved in polysaccharide export with SLBB domain
MLCEKPGKDTPLMKTLFMFIVICIFFLPSALFPQAVDRIQQAQEDNDEEPGMGQGNEMIGTQMQRLQLAISHEEYPVTPGDMYQLTFTTAGNLVSNNIFVGSDYTINLGVFGEINVRDMTFPQLKKRVEQLIQQGYPQSLPSLTMTVTGTFEIPIIGEIPRTRYVSAWGLSRLSDVVDGVLGRYSSTRDIRVISKNGDVQVYDLWAATYSGELSQNPLVKPGDRIEISRIAKEIQVIGEVYRPGKYQLIENESMQEVWQFTGGFTPLADLNRITVERFSGEQAELIVLEYKKHETEFMFKNSDIITVPSKRDEEPQVTVVGAVLEPGLYRFSPPEKYMYYVNLAGGIDLERNAKNEVHITDRYGRTRTADLPIMPGDTINVLNNDFVHNFNRYFPIVSTGFAFVLTVIQVINLANQYE